MMKKYTALFLAAVLSLSLLQLPAFALGEDLEDPQEPTFIEEENDENLQEPENGNTEIIDQDNEIQANIVSVQANNDIALAAETTIKVRHDYSELPGDEAESKAWFLKNITKGIGIITVPLGEDGSITINKPSNPGPITQELSDGSTVSWICTGVNDLHADNDKGKIYRFGENESVTFVPAASPVYYHWEIPKIQRYSVKYNLNTESLDGYDVYPVVAYQFTPSTGEAIGGIESFSGIPVCFFTDDNKWTGPLIGKDVQDGYVFEVGMGFGPGLAEPFVDFLARKENDDGTYSYKSLDNWTVDGTDTTVEQGSTYKPTSDVTLTANWVDVTDFGDKSDGPKLPLTSHVIDDYDATIYHGTSKDGLKNTELYLNANESTIYYTAQVKMNPLLASTHLLGGRKADEGFANFVIKVELDKNLELVAGDDGKVSIEFKCPFLVPEGVIKVNGEEVSIESTSVDGVHTITAAKSAIEDCYEEGKDTILELPVKWDVKADTSNLKEEMSMVATTQIKEGSTATEFTTTGSVTGSIDLSKANVNAHQVIRFILGDDNWKSFYKGNKAELDITDTLKAVEHLEYCLKNVELTANTVTAKAAYVSATGVTVTPATLDLTVGGSSQLTATVIPENATTKTVTWSSDAPAIATVDQNGNVTAVAPGSTVIRAEVIGQDGVPEGTPGTCAVTVRAASNPNPPPVVTPPAARTYTITFVIREGVANVVQTYTEGAAITAPNVESYTSGRYRYTFSGWSPALATVTADATYTAQFNSSYTGGGSGGSGGGGRTDSATARPRPTVSIGENDTPLAENPVRFVDVAQGSYCYEPVYWAVDKQITNGKTETTFVPSGPCTRVQTVTFLWRAAGSPAAEGQNPFTDVAADAYYHNAVLWAVAQGITEGTTATTFSPDAPCTRAQAVTFLHRAAGSPEVNDVENPFTDLADGAYYVNAVLWAVQKGVTGGTTATTFAPNATCSRGQIVTFLYRDRK